MSAKHPTTEQLSVIAGGTVVPMVPEGGSFAHVIVDVRSATKSKRVGRCQSDRLVSILKSVIELSALAQNAFELPSQAFDRW